MVVDRYARIRAADSAGNVPGWRLVVGLIAIDNGM